MEYQEIPKERSLLVINTSTKEIRSRHYDLLKRLIANIGEWNINIYALSKQWGIPNQTLYKWKDKLVAEKGVIDINIVGNRVKENMVSNLNLLQKAIHAAESVHQKKEAILAYNDTIKTFTDFLEAYGYKEKIADKLEINQKVVSVTFLGHNDNYPDIEGEKRRRKENVQAHK